MRRKLLACGLALGLLTAIAPTAPAHAADVVSAPLVWGVPEARQAVAYWLADGGANLKNATAFIPPYDVQGERTSGTIVPPGKPFQVGPVAPLAEGEPPRTTGKVFFVGGDHEPHWCSGVALQNAYRNLVATAAHCVYDMVSGPATNYHWVFIPGPATDGTHPYGIYAGKQVFTHYDFTQYRDPDRDVAFVSVFSGVVPSADGTLTTNGRLGDIVGGQGVTFNKTIDETTTPVDVFGYPVGPHPDGTRPYTGQSLERSTGQVSTTHLTSPSADQLVGVESPFTGEGSLGSPWLQGYEDERGLGYLNGITAGVSDTDGNGRYDTGISPYFDSPLVTIYRTAAANWTGRLT